MQVSNKMLSHDPARLCRSQQGAKMNNTNSNAKLASCGSYVLNMKKVLFLSAR
jgi:hypothetical protein